MAAATPVYEIALLRSRAELADLRSEWIALEEQSGAASPFLSPEWTLACLAHLRPQASPLVLAARRRGRLVALLALRLERQLGLRVLRFAADGRSDYLGVLAAPGHGAAVRALLERLAQGRPRWDLALLRQLDAGGPTAAGAPPRLRAREIEADVSPYLALPRDWEELRARGPSGLRQGVRRASRFAREGGVVERAAGPRAAALAGEVAEVEAASWKARRGTPHFAPGPGQRLLAEALAGLGARGRMELWLARMGDRAIAYLVNFRTPERVLYYQGAFREDARGHSPGSVLHARAIESACREGLREYDFGCGDEPYKAQWTTGARTIRHLALFPADPLGRLAQLTLVAPRWGLRGWRPAQAAWERVARARSAMGRP